jgi:hypothetical protein
MADADHTSYKDSIIRFILDSSEEENNKLAVFIDGLKAKKKISTKACPLRSPDTVFPSSPLPAEEIRI